MNYVPKSFKRRQRHFSQRAPREVVKANAQPLEHWLNISLTFVKVVGIVGAGAMTLFLYFNYDKDIKNIEVKNGTIETRRKEAETAKIEADKKNADAQSKLADLSYQQQKNNEEFDNLKKRFEFEQARNRARDEKSSAEIRRYSLEIADQLQAANLRFQQLTEFDRLAEVRSRAETLRLETERAYGVKFNPNLRIKIYCPRITGPHILSITEELANDSDFLIKVPSTFSTLYKGFVNKEELEEVLNKANSQNGATLTKTGVSVQPPLPPLSSTMDSNDDEVTQAIKWTEIRPLVWHSNPEYGNQEPPDSIKDNIKYIKKRRWPYIAPKTKIEYTEDAILTDASANYVGVSISYVIYKQSTDETITANIFKIESVPSCAYTFIKDLITGN